jgi:hypothetical protein
MTQNPRIQDLAKFIDLIVDAVLLRHTFALVLPSRVPEFVDDIHVGSNRQWEDV